MKTTFYLTYKTIESEGRQLEIILTKPMGNKKHPVVFFAQGIECSYVDPDDYTHPYNRFLYGLTLKGFATARVSKRNIDGRNEVKCKDIDFHTELADYIATMKYLYMLDFIDRKNVFCFGYSMGGVFGPLIAKEFYLRGIAVFGTIAKNWSEHVLECALRQGRLAGKKNVELAHELKKLKDFLLLLNKKKYTPVHIIENYPEFKDYFTDGSYVHGRYYTFFQQLSNINIIKVWGKLKIPALIVWGNADYVASLEDHERIYNVLLKSNSTAKKRLLKLNIDHFFYGVETMEESFHAEYENHFNEQIINEVSDWFKELTSL